MNTKAQIGLIEVGSANLPRWLLYPLVILICLTFICVIFFLGVVGYSCLKGNCNGYYGVPIGFYRLGPVLGFHSQECYVNGIKINCSEFSGDEHFCNNGICNMNGVCPSPNSNMSIQDCMKQAEGAK